MDEAERLCDRLVVMDGGRIIAEGSPRELVERVVGAHVVEVEDRKGARECVEELAAARDFEAHGGVLHVSTEEPQQVITAILARCGDVNASVRRATLEDVFLRLTGRRLRE
jgi:lipooligosaccharide transport system ATP-binding protein